MKRWILLFALFSVTNATFLTLLRRKFGNLSVRPILAHRHKPEYVLRPPTAERHSHHPSYIRYPVSYSVVPTGIQELNEKGIIGTGTIIPGEHTHPTGSNYQLVPGNGAVLNINTRSKDGWAYALQPIDDNTVHGPHHHPVSGLNQFPSTSYGVPYVLNGQVNAFNSNPSTTQGILASSSVQGLPDEELRQVFNAGDPDSTKLTSPIYVGSEDFAYPSDSNGDYTRSYTLSDGTHVTESGRLVTNENGASVLVKEGEYQYRRSDGKIVTVKWEADENGFRILN